MSEAGRFKACAEEVYRIFLQMFEGRGGTTLKGTTHRTRHIDRLNKELPSMQRTCASWYHRARGIDSLEYLGPKVVSVARPKNGYSRRHR